MRIFRMSSLQIRYQKVYFVWSLNKRRTSVWRCFTNRRKVFLGDIGWDSPFRGYVFRPGRELVIRPDTLREIAAFMSYLQANHNSNGFSTIDSLFVENDCFAES